MLLSTSVVTVPQQQLRCRKVTNVGKCSIFPFIWLSSEILQTLDTREWLTVPLLPEGWRGMLPFSRLFLYFLLKVQYFWKVPMH